MKRLRLLPTAALFVTLVLSGCGGNSNEQSDAPTTTPTTTASTTTAATSSTTTPPPPTTTVAETTTVEPIATYTELTVESPAAVPVEEPYILHCNPGGFGPIETYWSDGTVTGWSEYCQGVHDQTIADEVAANTPVCDGTVCRYPSGATMPDPAAPKTPSPWVQDQIDWFDCIDAGNSEDYCRQALN
ncbi:hypothetical protein ACLBYD_24045 [Rhodococcus sp. C26F]